MANSLTFPNRGAAAFSGEVSLRIKILSLLQQQNQADKLLQFVSRVGYYVSARSPTESGRRPTRGRPQHVQKSIPVFQSTLQSPTKHPCCTPSPLPPERHWTHNTMQGSQLLQSRPHSLFLTIAHPMVAALPLSRLLLNHMPRPHTLEGPSILDRIILFRRQPGQQAPSDYAQNDTLNDQRQGAQAGHRERLVSAIRGIGPIRGDTLRPSPSSRAHPDVARCIASMAG